MERIALSGLGAQLAVGVVGNIAAVGHGDDIVIGFRAGKITSKSYGGNRRLLAVCRDNAAEDQARQQGNIDHTARLERLYRWGRASLGRNTPLSELTKEHVQRIMPKYLRPVIPHARWRSSVAAVC